jgi:hypothetical protein
VLGRWEKSRLPSGLARSPVEVIRQLSCFAFPLFLHLSCSLSTLHIGWGLCDRLCLVFVCRGRYGLGGGVLLFKFILGSNLGGVGPVRGLRGGGRGGGGEEWSRSSPGDHGDVFYCVFFQNLAYCHIPTKKR